jgi:phosphohistidine phosphatase
VWDSFKPTLKKLNMKRVVLIRHAKATPWGYENDFERELTEKGRNDAGKVSRRLREEGIIPEIMVASPALRAFETAAIFASEFGITENEIIRDHELYHGYTTGELIQMIRALPDEKQSVFIFGHNPSFEYYASGLCRSFRNEIPTCSAVVIDFETESWKMAAAREGTLFRQFNPKEL